MSHDHAVERPLGGKILTPGMLLLLAIIIAGALLFFYRIFAGIGAVSNQSDGYPWGIWEPLCIVVFTGIGAGALAMGLTSYVFNQWHYHPLIRSAIMTGAMAYTLGGTAVIANLGRMWNIWVLFWPPIYNLNSVLLEVAICVMSYFTVLWIELVPPIFERFAEPDEDGKVWIEDLKKAGLPMNLIQRIAILGLPIMRKALPFIISLALLLPTMHQASLGGLYMVTATKLHPLWHTAWISGLFLISCLMMGFSGLVIVENLTSTVYHREMDQKLLARMAPIPAMLTFAYLAIRIGDIIQQGRFGLVFKLDMYSIVFLTEITLFFVPAVLMMQRKWVENRGKLLFAAILLVTAGAMYRMDTFLTAYRPVSGWSYSPSWGELLFSACLLSVGIAVYVVMAKLFPLLSGVLKTDKIRL
jgi:Ni/Fe-hydrogenase subunit HybB-like protein